jgi:hypothetical protein
MLEAHDRRFLQEQASEYANVFEVLDPHMKYTARQAAQAAGDADEMEEIEQIALYLIEKYPQYLPPQDIVDSTDQHWTGRQWMDAMGHHYQLWGEDTLP